jgi:ABC-type multidrug transport system permease subunit
MLKGKPSERSDWNSQLLPKWPSLLCNYTVYMFLYHCLLLTRFSSPVVFAVTIIIIIIIIIVVVVVVIIIVRQQYPNNIDPAVNVQQNILGLFVTGPLN